MIINHILKAWTAGFVRRWHVQPELSQTNDMNHGHQHRCVVLLLMFWPDSSRASIIDTLVHDQGEVDAGDVSRPTKQKYPEIYDQLQIVEEESIAYQGFILDPIRPIELDRRRFVDSLDSYLWMLVHKPCLVNRPEWLAQKRHLDDCAINMEIQIQYSDFMAEAEERYIF